MMKRLVIWSLLAAFVSPLSPLPVLAARDAAAPTIPLKAQAGGNTDSSPKAQSSKTVPFANATEIAKSPDARKYEKAVFGLGCFWKSQHVFARVPGVVRTRVGYSGGKPANPTYEQVCSHTTGHAEVVEVEYDPKKVTYEKLLDVFFTSHDPTTLNRQGLDFGDQYRSAIFFTTAAQKAEAISFKAKLEKAHRFMSPIVTDISPAATFYSAEDYHQDYYKKHGAVCF